MDEKGEKYLNKISLYLNKIFYVFGIFAIIYFIYENNFDIKKIGAKFHQILNKHYHFDNDILWYFLAFIFGISFLWKYIFPEKKEQYTEIMDKLENRNTEYKISKSITFMLLTIALVSYLYLLLQSLH